MNTTEETERDEHEEALEHDDEHDDDKQHDDEPELEAETEPAPDPAEGLEEPSGLMMAELTAACDEHHDRVRSIMGSFVAGFEPCDECLGSGLAVPRAEGPKLQHAQGYTTCSICAGIGELETGSNRQGYELIGCVHCGGKGYVGPTTTTAAAAVEQHVAEYPAGNGAELEPAQPPSPEATDPWVAEAEQRGYIVLKKPGA